MRQHTTPEQTAKLIELGLPKPRYYCADKYTIIHTGFDIINYSIGELIEMLPPKIDGRNLVIERYKELGQWLVCHESCLGVYSMSAELSDALYDMVIKLKEEEVI